MCQFSIFEKKFEREKLLSRCTFIKDFFFNESVGKLFLKNLDFWQNNLVGNLNFSGKIWRDFEFFQENYRHKIQIFGKKILRQTQIFLRKDLSRKLNLFRKKNGRKFKIFQENFWQ